MASVNKVILVGNLCADPETRYLTSGDTVCNVRLATNEKWRDKDGNQQERVEYHNVTFYRKLAEVVGQYLSKGDPAYIEGKLRTRKYQDKDGKDCWTTYVEGAELQMLGSKGGRDGRDDRNDRRDEPRRDNRDDSRRDRDDRRDNRRDDDRSRRDRPSFDDLGDDLPF